MEKDKQIKLGFVFLAVAFAGLALYLRQFYGDDLRDRYSVSGRYRSSLLDKEVSPASLRAVALGEEFRSAIEGTVDVRRVPDKPYSIQVTTTTTNEESLKNAQARAIDLLSTKLKELALTDITDTLKYLEDAETGAARLSEQISKHDRLPDYYEDKTLSRTDSSRIGQLQGEIAEIEAFLKGNELTPVLRLKIESKALAEAEERVRDAERELARLAGLFVSTHKVVQAQQDYTSKRRQELRALQEELAGVYLKTLRLELHGLEDKAESLIEENRSRVERPAGSSSVPDVGNSAKSNWMSERAAVLRSRAKEIAQAATLQQEGALEFSRGRGRSQHLLALCWVASLLSLLAALFHPRGTVLSLARVPGDERASTAANQPPPPVVRLEFPSLLKEQPLEMRADRFEAFFSRIYFDISEALGRPPRRLLVLGEQSVESRLAFSIRLANNLAREQGAVRLIDFDLHGKSLSERLGRQSLPGVGELLVGGGPVEEFFSSIAGTRIQFAPAGMRSLIDSEVQPDRVNQILEASDSVATVIDASSASPLHLVVHQVDAVLYAIHRTDHVRSAREQEVLVTFRDAGLPVWEVSAAEGYFYPLL